MPIVDRKCKNDFQNTTGDDFNNKGKVVGGASPELIKTIFPKSYCPVCKHEDEPRGFVCEINEEGLCPSKIKDKDPRKYPVVETWVTKIKGPLINKPEHAVKIRTGQLHYLYVNYIWANLIRGSAECGIDMHHKDSNAYNNHGSNIAMVSTHDGIHSELKFIETQRVLLWRENKNNLTRAVKAKLLKLEEQHKHLSKNIGDCPNWWKMQYFQFALSQGLISYDQCREILSKQYLAYPRLMMIQETKLDQRKMLSQKKRITIINKYLDLEKRLEESGKLQDVLNKKLLLEDVLED